MLRSSGLSLFSVVVYLTSASSLSARGAGLESGITQRIDAIAKSVLASTGVPSASLAIVKEGNVAYLRAYGQARLDPPSKAEPKMRYAVGSISKQFTAAAVLLLVEEGKLQLDDPVSKFFPDLTRASEIYHTDAAVAYIRLPGLLA